MYVECGPSIWTTLERIIGWSKYTLTDRPNGRSGDVQLDGPNIRSLTVQMDDGPMDRPCYVNLDHPNGRWSNGPPMLRQFGPSKDTVVDRSFRPSKITVGDRNFGPLKKKKRKKLLNRLTIWLEKCENKRMYTVNLAVQITLFLYYYTLLNWGEGGGQYNCRTTRSCIIRPYYQAAGRTQ